MQLCANTDTTTRRGVSPERVFAVGVAPDRDLPTSYSTSDSSEAASCLAFLAIICRNYPQPRGGRLQQARRRGEEGKAHAGCVVVRGSKSQDEPVTTLVLTVEESEDSPIGAPYSATITVQSDSTARATLYSAKRVCKTEFKNSLNSEGNTPECHCKNRRRRLES